MPELTPCAAIMVLSEAVAAGPEFMVMTMTVAMSMMVVPVPASAAPVAETELDRRADIDRLRIRRRRIDRRYGIRISDDGGRRIDRIRGVIRHGHAPGQRGSAKDGQGQSMHGGFP